MSLKNWIYHLTRSETVGQLFRFGLVGIIATALHYGVYLGLKRLISITLAFIIGYGVSFIVNYFLTARFTFSQKTSIRTSIGFFGAHLFNLALQTILLHAFIHLGIGSSWAPIPVYAIAIPVNFLLVRSVFSEKKVH